MAETSENQLVVYVNCPNGNLLQLLVLTAEVQQQFATYCSLATYCSCYADPWHSTSVCMLIVLWLGFDLLKDLL